MEGVEGQLLHIYSQQTVPHINKWHQQMSMLVGVHIHATQHLFIYQRLFNSLDSQILATKTCHFVDWFFHQPILAVYAECPTSEVELTDSRILREAEQCHVPIVAVRSIVIEIGGKVCLC